MVTVLSVCDDCDDTDGSLSGGYSYTTTLMATVKVTSTMRLWCVI